MHPPPNDNRNHPFHQYLQKLTARTQFQPPLTSRVPNISQPPTRYTPVITHKESELEYDDDYDEYDDYYDREDTVEYCSTLATAPDSEPNASYGNGLKTVTINLNSSIQNRRREFRCDCFTRGATPDMDAGDGKEHNHKCY